MVAPYFFDDIDELKGRLRLSAVPDSTDAQEIIEDALEQVQAGMAMRLGTDRLGELQDLFDTMATPSPTVDEEVNMAICRVLEVTWTRVILMDRLPMLWMDQSGGDREIYNQEGAFRGLSPTQLRDQMDRMEQQIQDWLNFLLGSEDELEIGFTTCKPRCPELGKSLFRRHTPEITDVRPGDFDGNFIDEILE